MMTEDRVQTPTDALLYFAECSLATCGDLANRKRTSQSEFQRHVKITRTVLNFLQEFTTDMTPIEHIKAGLNNTVEHFYNNK